MPSDDGICWALDVQIYNMLKYLAHLPLDKMAAILADNTFNYIYLNENDRIPTQISLQESNWQ